MAVHTHSSATESIHPPVTIWPRELQPFRLTRLRLRLKAKETLHLPAYKGAVLRGGFGEVFRRIACPSANSNFNKCLLGSICPYHYIFETPPPADSVVLEKIPTAPQPFIIEPPLEAKRVYEPGEELTFHLVLIGKALDYFPYFIYTFDELGHVGLGRRSGCYTLESVDGLETVGTFTPIYDGSRKMLTNPVRSLSLSQLPTPSFSLSRSQLSVSFLTPTRLKHENRLMVDCEFHVLFRNLVRRIALLNYFHCGGAFFLERREFIEQARAIKTVSSSLDWIDYERYSNRQQRWTPLGGFVGQVTYQGDFIPFLPYLRLGEYTHVGKGATFGLGAYSVDAN